VNDLHCAIGGADLALENDSVLANDLGFSGRGGAATKFGDFNGIEIVRYEGEASHVYQDPSLAGGQTLQSLGGSPGDYPVRSHVATAGRISRRC
jgi:hypothetical protein